MSDLIEQREQAEKLSSVPLLVTTVDGFIICMRVKSGQLEFTAISSDGYKSASFLFSGYETRELFERIRRLP